MRRVLVLLVSVGVFGLVGCPGPAPGVDDGGTGGGDGGGSAGGGRGGGIAGGGGGGGGGTVEEDGGQDAGEDAGEDAGGGGGGGAGGGGGGGGVVGDGGEWQGYDAGPALRDFVCSPTKWCFSYPYPHSLPINSIVQDGKSGVLAVSPQAIGFMQGTVVRTEGPTWGWAPFPAHPNVQEAVAVDQAGLSGQLWGYGNSGLYRWNGSAWSFKQSMPTYAIDMMGFDDANAFVVGNAGMLGQLGADGGFAFQYTDAGTLSAVWGSSPQDVWTAATKALRHFNGTSWSDVATPTTEPVSSIRGSAPNDVWFGGGAYNGAGFIWHWDGSSVTASSAVLGQVRGFAVESPTRAWAITSRGHIYFWNGTSWTLVKSVIEPLTTVMRRWNGEVWVGGFNGLIMSTIDGGSWEGERAPADEGRRLFSVSADERYAVGENGSVLRWREDAGWNLLATLRYADGGEAALVDGFSAAPNDLWISAGPSVFRFDGAQWVELPMPSGMKSGAISGTSSDDVWVTNSRDLAHWDGGAWGSYTGSGFDFMTAVKSFTPTAGLAAANGFWRWDGGSWGQAGTGYGINAMYAQSMTSAWGVCDYGRIVYFNGTSTNEVRPLDFNAQRLTMIGGTSSTDIWAGGYNTLLHWDGGSWGTFTSVQYFDHSSIIAATPTDVMVSTWRDGDILRYRP